MHSPVKNLILAKYPKGDVTQWFAENPALYARMDLAGHNGIDIVRPHGEQMYAVEDAVVVNVKDSPEGYGRHVRIIGREKNRKGFYNEWTYGHCHTIQVKVGDKVLAGQPIATMGNTGFVVSGHTPFWQHNPFAGTHLHFGLRQVSKPRHGGWSYEGSDVRIEVNNYGNRYKGSIDPFPLLAVLSETDEEHRAKLLTVRSLANALISLLKQRI